MNTEQIKPGGKLLLSKGGWSKPQYIATVNRLTKNQIVLQGNLTRFSRRTGYEVGNGRQSIVKIALYSDIEKIRLGAELSTAGHELVNLAARGRERAIENIDSIIAAATEVKRLKEALAKVRK